jgi:hypothetical protein
MQVNISIISAVNKIPDSPEELLIINRTFTCLSALNRQIHIFSEG